MINYVTQKDTNSLIKRLESKNVYLSDATKEKFLGVVVDGVAYVSLNLPGQAPIALVHEKMKRDTLWGVLSMIEENLEDILFISRVTEYRAKYMFIVKETMDDHIEVEDSDFLAGDKKLYFNLGYLKNVRSAPAELLISFGPDIVDWGVALLKSGILNSLLNTSYNIDVYGSKKALGSLLKYKRVKVSGKLYEYFVVKGGLLSKYTSIYVFCDGEKLDFFSEEFDTALTKLEMLKSF